jgi:hypothetical protein
MRKLEALYRTDCKAPRWPGYDYKLKISREAARVRISRTEFTEGIKVVPNAVRLRFAWVKAVNAVTGQQLSAELYNKSFDLLSALARMFGYADLSL